MIVVKLKGGLGNQMFQYAYGRALSLSYNKKLLLDLSSYPDEYGRDYELEAFNIDASLLNRNILKALSYLSKYRRTASFLGCFFSFFKWSFIVEKEYQSELILKSKNLFLNGYWQSEEYFKDIRNTLLNDFSLKKNVDERNSVVIREIEASESVSIHVRRCDYVNDFKTRSIHGACSLDYYKKAVNYVKKKVETPTFFIFSDDPEWTSKNMPFDGKKRFISGNSGNNGSIDLYLMSKCKHNIIANSTFSWWSAWLNENRNKIIVSPEKWFAEEDINRRCKIIPSSWVKI